MAPVIRADRLWVSPLKKDLWWFETSGPEGPDGYEWEVGMVPVEDLQLVRKVVHEWAMAHHFRGEVDHAYRLGLISIDRPEDILYYAPTSVEVHVKLRPEGTPRFLPPEFAESAAYFAKSKREASS